MRNFISKFIRILKICKDFAENRVNNLGNVPRCGVVPKFSDLEVVLLGITTETFSFDNENLLFHQLHKPRKSERILLWPLMALRMCSASTPSRSKSAKT